MLLRDHIQARPNELDVLPLFFKKRDKRLRVNRERIATDAVDDDMTVCDEPQALSTWQKKQSRQAKHGSSLENRNGEGRGRGHTRGGRGGRGRGRGRGLGLCDDIESDSDSCSEGAATRESTHRESGNNHPSGAAAGAVSSRDRCDVVSGRGEGRGRGRGHGRGGRGRGKPGRYHEMLTNISRQASVSSDSAESSDPGDDFDKIREKNIRRNMRFMEALGFEKEIRETITEPVKTRRESGCPDSSDSDASVSDSSNTEVDEEYEHLGIYHHITVYFSNLMSLI